MKFQFPRHRVLILLILIASVGLGFTIHQDALAFSNQLSLAFQHNTINGIEVVKCLDRRTILTARTPDNDFWFHKNYNDQSEKPYPWGLCDKTVFELLPGGLPEIDKKLLGENQITAIRNALDNSYFVRNIIAGVIVSDAVYFHDASKNKSYAVYYWQSKERVSVAVWNDSDSNSDPIARSNMLPNEFTDKLYAMFIEKN